MFQACQVGETSVAYLGIREIQLFEPVEIPGIGRYVSFTDTEGNRVSLLQPSNG